MNLGKIDTNNILHGLISPEKIREISRVEVTSELLYPSNGSLFDENMEGDNHFGHLELSRPLMHPDFLSTIYHLLKFTCSECARVLISQKKIDDFLEENEKDRDLRALKAFSEFRGTINLEKCPHCGSEPKRIRFEKPYKFTENCNKLTPLDIYRRLEMISLSDARLFGLTENVKPEWMVLTVLPIPPIPYRQKSKDMLNEKLSGLVATNSVLRSGLEKGLSSEIIESLWKAMQELLIKAWLLLPSK